MNASYSGRPISDIACCSRLAALAGLHLGGLLGDQRPRLVRGHHRAEVLADRAQVDRHRVDPALVDREHPVLVAGEVGEPVGVLPDPRVRGVEQVRAVAVDLDPGLRAPARCRRSRRCGGGARGSSTRRPRSLAHRSAMVSPKKPDPTTTRSAFTRPPTGRSRRLRLAALGPARGLAAPPPPCRVVRDDRAVHRAAQPPGDQPVAAADQHVAHVLGGEVKPAPAELALQPQLGAEQPRCRRAA